MNRKYADYEQKLRQWESEGYDISEFRKRWFSSQGAEGEEHGKYPGAEPKNKKLPWWGIATLIIGLLAIGTGIWYLINKPSPITQSFIVPDGVDAIAKVNIKDILNDKDIASLYNCYMKAEDPHGPQTLEGALDELRNETGVDLKYFDEAVLFADYSTMETESPYWGAIIECNYPLKYLFELFKNNLDMDFKTKKYHRYKIYTVEDEIISITFLTSELAAIGSYSAVKDVIDVGIDEASPTRGEVYDLYNNLGDPLFKLALPIPYFWIEGLPSEIHYDEYGNYGTVNLLPLRDIHICGGSLDKNGSVITAKVELSFTDSSSAIDAGESIQKIIKICSIYPEWQPEMSKLLSRIWMQTYDTHISLQLDTTTTDIEELIGLFS